MGTWGPESIFWCTGIPVLHRTNPQASMHYFDVKRRTSAVNSNKECRKLSEVLLHPSDSPPLEEWDRRQVWSMKGWRRWSQQNGRLRIRQRWPRWGHNSRLHWHGQQLCAYVEVEARGGSSTCRWCHLRTWSLESATWTSDSLHSGFPLLTGSCFVLPLYAFCKCLCCVSSSILFFSDNQSITWSKSI